MGTGALQLPHRLADQVKSKLAHVLVDVHLEFVFDFFVPDRFVA